MTVYTEARINDTYEVILPDFREIFHRARPLWEKGRLASCAELMTPGMVVYDIGAEHGDFTALYRKWVGDDGDVIPVEPAAHYWPFIMGTWEANRFPKPPQLSYVGLVGQVASRTRGDHPGSWPEECFGEGIPDGGFLHLAHDKTSPRTTIDQLCRFVTPDAIVIDIEGAECHALLGGRKTLENHRPLVWVSVHEPTMLKWYGKTLDNILAYMKSMRYSVTELPHHGEGETFFLFTP